jgi:hypothetical protein
MASIAEASSLFEIDMELDGLLEEIEGQVESEGQAAEDLVARFQQFCAAHGEKVDRIGRFVRIMEAREEYCRSEAARLTDRARAAAGKQTDSIPSILSISWGWPEEHLPGPRLWTEAAIETVEDRLAALALRGVTVVVSSGDLGSMAQYPASSEFVLSCGGTVNPFGAEGVWNNHQNASGGGVSAFIGKPAWQGNAIQCVGPLDQPQPSQNRCFPDVAAWALYSSPVVPLLAQGTSAAAPQWSAVLALANECLAQSGLPVAGHFNSHLYDPGSNINKSLNDVLTGNNSLGSQLTYVAKQDWDACTGWGTPRVLPFLQALVAASQRASGH